MDTVFNWCVDFLVWLAAQVGMTYNEINVWIFVIIEPVVFVIMLMIILRQRRKIRALTRQ